MVYMEEHKTNVLDDHNASVHNKNDNRGIKHHKKFISGKLNKYFAKTVINFDEIKY